MSEDGKRKKKKKKNSKRRRYMINIKCTSSRYQMETVLFFIPIVSTDKHLIHRIIIIIS